MQDGYKELITYKLARIAFDLIWDFVPLYYFRFEDNRQRDQMKQAIRSHKQNIVEGSSDRSLSSKLTLYDVAQSSGKEVKEDCEDILRKEGLSLWGKNDPRLRKLREAFEFPFSPPCPSTSLVLAVFEKEVGGLEGNRGIRKEQVEIVVNYLVDILARNGYLLDRQIRAVEQKHQTEGGYKENLLKKRLAFRKSLLSLLFYFLLLPSLSLYFLLFLFPSRIYAANSGIFSVSAWVKPETSVASKAIVGKAEELRIATNASGQPLCQFMSSSAWQASVTSSTAISVNSWSHIACTYDKTNIKIYVNGVGVGSSALSTSPDDTAAALKYGIDDSASTPYSSFKGTIDELKFYNYARSQKQIVEDMNAGHPAVGSPIGSAVAHWKFDEGYGTTVNNSGFGGLGLLGTLGSGSSSPSWTNDGKFGKALSFDGGDYASIADNNSLDLSQYSISFWVKTPSRSSGDWMTTVVKGITSNENYGVYFGNTTISRDKIRLQFTHGGSYTSSTVDSVGLFADNTWHHFLGTFDGSVMKIYKDGVLDNSSSNTNSPDQNANSLTIGQRSSSVYYTGSLDDLKIYNYALTDEEIHADFNSGSSLILGSLSTGSSNPAPSSAGSQEYCIPGDTSICSPPVGRWDFNEGVGNTVNDTSGSGNVGSWNGTGTHWGTGKQGKAGKFNGTNDYISVNHSSIFNITSSITIEAWIKTTDGSDNYITTKVDDSWYVGIGPTGTTANKISFYLNGVSSGWLQGTSNINDNLWHHVVGSWDGTTIKVFVDGKQENSTVKSGTIGTGTSVVRIGFRTSDYFNGLIDQVRIYNYARTAAQIAWDYNEGKPVAWYKMDECQGNLTNSTNETNSTSLAGTLNIGSLGTQSSAGTCALGIGSSTAWGIGSSGKLNASINFDGIDDYAIGSTTPIMAGVGQSYGSVSFGAWIKPTTSVASKTIINKNSEFKLETDSNSKANCNVYIGGAWKTAAVSSSAIPLSSWSHVICTYDGTNIKVYVNSLNTGTQAQTTSIVSLSSTALSIARDPTPSQYFNGQIDEVKIWNYGLTAVQVKTDYNQGMGIRFGN